MDIKINLSNEYGANSFEASNLNEEQASKLVDAFIGSLGIPATPIQYAEPLQMGFATFEPCSCHDKSEEDINESISDTYMNMIKGEVELNEADQQAMMDAYPRLETEGAQTEHIEVQSFGTNLGDKLSEALLLKSTNMAQPVADKVETVESAPVKQGYTEQQDFHQTGIKYKTINGVPNVPTYRCRWECTDPMCNDKGKHYIPEGTQTVYCYTCNTKLKVEEATDLGFPNRDAWGNFYVAYEEVEDRRR